MKCPYCHKPLDPKLLAQELGSLGGLKNKSKGSDYFKKIRAIGVKKQQEYKISNFSGGINEKDL